MRPYRIHLFYTEVKMKKFVLIALVLVMATAFAFAAFQAPPAGVAVEPPQSLSFWASPPTWFTPNVGWNS
jgi:hypothetical protein